jgi:hypothetical protein
MVMHMSKNPEFAKYALDLARSQDNIRTSNEDLIKLTQRFGRMIPKLHKLDSPAILSWFGLYNKIKDNSRKADDEITSHHDNNLASLNPVLQSHISYYCAQRQRLYSKMEVMDDILNGMMEDLLENGSYEEEQKHEMRMALDVTLEKSLHHTQDLPVMA